MTYEVIIEETLKRAVCVEAETEQAAVEEVDRMIADGELVLTSDNRTDLVYKVAPMLEIRVVTPNTKVEWIRRILSIGVDEDITLQLNSHTFLWVDHFIEDENDILLIEVNKGMVEDCFGDKAIIFQEVLETYKLRLADLRTTVDTLLDVMDSYVKKEYKASDIIGGILGVTVVTGLLSFFSVLIALM